MINCFEKLKLNIVFDPVILFLAIYSIKIKVYIYACSWMLFIITKTVNNPHLQKQSNGKQSLQFGIQ